MRHRNNIIQVLVLLTILIIADVFIIRDSNILDSDKQTAEASTEKYVEFDVSDFQDAFEENHSYLYLASPYLFDDSIEFGEDSVDLTYHYKIPYEYISQNDSTLKADIESDTEILVAESYFIDDLPLSEDLQEYTYEQCQAADLPDDFYYLMLALMEKESQFDPSTISAENWNGSRDYGMCQLNSTYHSYYTETYGITDFLDAKQNIYCSIQILSEFYDKYKNEPSYHQILMCYNMGEGNVLELNAKGIYSSEYSREIVGRYEDFKEMTVYDGGL